MIAIVPKSRKLESTTRMYSCDPVPSTRSLRESMNDSAHIQATTRTAEKIQ